MIKIPVSDRHMLVAMQYAFSMAVIDMEKLKARYEHTPDLPLRSAIHEAHAAMQDAVLKLNAIKTE